jgi:hypothetical protein
VQSVSEKKCQYWRVSASVLLVLRWNLTCFITRGKKRLEEDPQSAFVDAAKQSKKRKISRSVADTSYIDAFQDALSIYSKACAFCLMFNRDSLYHSILRCNTLQSDIEGYSTGTFLDWKGSVRYNSKLHSKICFFCHIPQCDDKLHDTFKHNASSCCYPDVVSPVAFAIFCKPDLKLEAQNRFEMEWPTLGSYAKWLCGPPIKGHKTNMTAIFLWYSNVYLPQSTQ